MGRIIWYGLSAVVAIVLVTVAYQANTSNTHGRSSSAGAYQSSGSGANNNALKDFRLNR